MTMERKQAGQQNPPGLLCRKCGCGHFRMLETRKALGRIVRRRECRHCGGRLTTVEREADHGAIERAGTPHP